jgi:gamma-glutamylputrescine oxidase
MTVSHWRRHQSPALLECDVAIIGAGICGLSAALHLQKRGLVVEILERHTIGSGASTRNAGFLMRGAADNYKVAIDEYGRDLARQVWRWSEENLEGLLSEGLGTLDSVREIPSALLTLEEDEWKELVASVDLLKQDGFEVGWVEPGRTGGHALAGDALWAASGAAKRPLGALVNPRDASCHSCHVIKYLAGKLQRPAHEHQEVAEMAALPGASNTAGPRVELRTPDLRVRTRFVLVCTNAYAPLLFPQLEGLVRPRRGQMIAYKPPREFHLGASYYANRGSEYFRQAFDGTLVVGGCRTYHAEREIGYDDITTPWVQGDLQRFARDIFGPAADAWPIIARWAGTMGFSPDGLPLIGPIPARAEDAWQPAQGAIWFCGAFTGHGMSLAYRLSRIAIESMLDGGPNPLPLSRATARQ